MKSQARVFFSYSRKDVQFVQQLRRDLVKENLSIWVDEEQIMVGKSIVESIADGLKNSDYFVIVLSKAGVASKWVAAEMNFALNSELSEKCLTLLPVLIETCDVPPLLRDRLWADFRDSYKSGLRQLLQVLHMEDKKPVEGRKSYSPNVLVLNAEQLDDCPTKLRRLKQADIRRRIVARMSRPEVGSVWFDTFEDRMDDHMPQRGINDCAIELIKRSNERAKYDDLLSNLCIERPDICTAV